MPQRLDRGVWELRWPSKPAGAASYRVEERSLSLDRRGNTADSMAASAGESQPRQKFRGGEGTRPRRKPHACAEGYGVELRRDNGLGVGANRSHSAPNRIARTSPVADRLLSCSRRLPLPALAGALKPPNDKWRRDSATPATSELHVAPAEHFARAPVEPRPPNPQKPPEPRRGRTSPSSTWSKPQPRPA